MIDYLKLFDITTQNGNIENRNGIINCSILGRGTDAVFEMVGSFECLDDYFVLEYSGFGIKRRLLERTAFVSLNSEDNNTKLFAYDDLFFDEKKHLIISKVSGSFSKMIFSFGVAKCERAEFNIYKLYSCKKEELPVCLDEIKTETAFDLTPIELTTNGSFAFDENIIIDGGRFFENKEENLSKIPFIFNVEGNNAIVPSAPPIENDEEIINFGVKCKRRLARPISRDSKNEIIINKKASEIFFVFGIDGIKNERCEYATDGVIVGDYCPDVTKPILINDTERFLVEIIYSNGNHDTAVPYNIKTKRHGISGDIGVYGVPCEYEKIEKIVIHNKMLDTNVLTLAATVNEAENRVFAEMQIPSFKMPIEKKASKGFTADLDENKLIIKNGAIEFEFNTQNGLKLVNLKNEFTPSLSIKEDSFLKIDYNGEDISGKLSFEGVNIKNDSVELTYSYGLAVVTIIGSSEKENGILWDMKIKNGNEAVKLSIVFPNFKGVMYESNEDSWYFFPKYQNIESNENIDVYEESAPSFPMQFMDVYSKNEFGGIGLVTHERECKVRNYAISKYKDGVNFFVEYPKMYTELEKNEVFSISQTLILAHNNDWRRSFSEYQAWLANWYKPEKCQNKEWYRKCFWLLAEICDFYETMDFVNLPIWYNKETQEFNLKRILEEQKSITGYYPDILHLWSWAYKKDGEHFTQQWGNFGESDYNEYGGREAFKNALHDVRNDGVNVSLYLHPTLLSGRYPQAKEFFPNYRVTDKNDNFIAIEGDSYRMCHANEVWRKHAIEMYKRVYSELQIPLLYVDEFSLRVENRCYNKNHGHHVPSNLLKTDRDFISELRSAMPEEVVLYGEYYAVDINARYIDCNISYYIIDSVVDMVENTWRADNGDDRLGRVFIDTYRFAFPKIVQLILPMAMRNLSWHPLKFLFFNGEAVYDSFWDCEESAGLEFMIKAYEIKKKYSDCFMSDNPRTMIDTLSSAICVNEFGIKDKTLYTIYNRAYSTYRGNAFKVPHIEGNVYLDVWNDKTIEPEIVDGFAIINMSIDAQQVGCVLVEKSIAK